MILWSHGGGVRQADLLDALRCPAPERRLPSGPSRNESIRAARTQPDVPPDTAWVGHKCRTLLRHHQDAGDPVQVHLRPCASIGHASADGRHSSVVTRTDGAQGVTAPASMLSRRPSPGARVPDGARAEVERGHHHHHGQPAGRRVVRHRTQRRGDQDDRAKKAAAKTTSSSSHPTGSTGPATLQVVANKVRRGLETPRSPPVHG